MTTPKPCTMPEEIASRVSVDNNGCWNWLGNKNKIGGYGTLSVKGASKFAHRYSYELCRGKIKQGLVIDHLCRNPSCVNPNHLEPVTQRTNVMRGNAITKENAEKVKCSRGHLYAPENIRISNRKDGVRRICKTCDRDTKRKKLNLANPNRERRISKIMKADLVEKMEGGHREDI